MKFYTRWASVLAVAALLVAVTACKKSAPKSNAADSLSASAASARETPDPFAAPDEYKTEKVCVGLDIDVTQDGKTFTFKGKPAKDAILPDGTRVSLGVSTCINGAFVRPGETVTVKDGVFEGSLDLGFYGGFQLPNGKYTFEAFIFPEQQPTALQAMFGERGANLVGPQSKPDGKRTIVYYTQHFLEIDSPEGKEVLQQMERDISQQRTALSTLYKELYAMKDSPDFAAQGLTAGNGKAWLSRVRKAGLGDKSTKGFYGKRIAENLEVLGISYQASKGTDTDQTNSSLYNFLHEYQMRLGPNYVGISTAGITNFVSGLSSGRKSISSAVGKIISSEPAMGDAFTVTSTSKDHVFYTGETLESQSVQIAVERVPGEFYGDRARLKQKNFQIVGMGRFSTVMGAERDLVILKPVVVQPERLPATIIPSQFFEYQVPAGYSAE